LQGFAFGFQLGNAACIQLKAPAGQLVCGFFKLGTEQSGVKHFSLLSWFLSNDCIEFRAIDRCYIYRGEGAAPTIR
jgi:hypothetical protein